MVDGHSLHATLNNLLISLYRTTGELYARTWKLVMSANTFKITNFVPVSLLPEQKRKQKEFLTDWYTYEMTKYTRSKKEKVYVTGNRLQILWLLWEWADGVEEKNGREKRVAVRRITYAIFVAI